MRRQRKFSGRYFAVLLAGVLVLLAFTTFLRKHGRLWFQPETPPLDWILKEKDR